MIDWHSHVLPNMDDGSHSDNESIEMLKSLKTQGVDTVIATPHFYANDESVTVFLKRRSDAYNKLLPHLNGEVPKVLLGAEVSYYPGISRMEDLHKLKIENSNLLLLEMPFSRWTEYTVREIIDLSRRTEFEIVLAHIERYIHFQSKEVIERVFDSGILMQANASFFTSAFKKQKAIFLLKQWKINFIGSDCHNMTSRPPNIKNAYDYISRKTGEDFLIQINEFGKTKLV